MTGLRKSDEATSVAAPEISSGSIVERRSIEPVPLNERHGASWHLGTLWFMASAQLTTLAVGLIGPVIGASFFTSALGMLAGTVFGTFFMAFHSAQGPRLGLPQMIQSRAQFGYLGALVPMAVVLLVTSGFLVFDVTLFGAALNAATGASMDTGIVICAIVALVVAIVGYRWIHAAERWLAYLFLIFFGVLTVAAFTTIDLPEGQFTFQWMPFLALFGIAAGYQLSWAPYVSDYSRYLPPEAGHRAPFWWSYLGSALGAVWLMTLGAYLAAASPGNDAFQGIITAGDNAFGGFGKAVLLYSLLGLVTCSTLSAYTGGLTAITMVDSLKRIDPAKWRNGVLVVFTVVATAVAMLSSEDFINNYHSFLLGLLYFLIPWTSVNLVDYYIVRRSHYAIRELFNPSGIYGVWSRNGLVSYVVGFVLMIPFFSVPGLFVGPVAESMGGADLAIFIGLPVSGLLYWAMSRNLRLDHERQVAREGDGELQTSLPPASS